MKKFKTTTKKIGLYESYENWYAFLLGMLKDYDMDGLIIVYGIARSGKSTFTLDLIRRIVMYRNEWDFNTATGFLVRTNFVKNNMVYEKDEKLEDRYSKLNESFVVYDDSYLVVDKRDMKTSQGNKIIHAMNIFANHKNLTFVLIQNYQHIDFRLRDKSIMDFFCFTRGLIYSFSQFKSAMVQNTDLYDMENQSIYELSTPKGLDRILKTRPSFIKKIHPPKLDDAKDPFYGQYMDWKNYHQGKVVF